MPIKSKAQQRAMYAAASGKGESDIPKKVAKEYIAATPSSAYGKMPERTRKPALKRKSSTY
jgi:hypothetical protein